MSNCPKARGVLLRGAGAAVALSALLAGPTRAQTQSQAFSACYVPQVGAMYLIKRTGLPAACLSVNHVEISWTELAFAGTGTALTVARSDHTHALGGTGNTGIGAGALTANSGANNTSVGAFALDANTSGSDNTALGSDALGVNTTAGSNTAVGARALLNNTASGNTAVGASALDNNSVGTGNTALGVNALGVNGSGSNNTAVGAASLANSTGGNNIGLGAGAGGSLAGGSDNIYIGNVGATSESGTIRIGSASHARALIAGIRGVTTGTADAVAVLIDSQGQLGTVSSSRRFKEEIRDLGETSRGLLRLRPVSFRYRQPSADGAKPLQYGLIAEEVAEVFPELVAYDPDGLAETVLYHVLPTLLLSELQRQEAELVAVRRTLAAQAALLEELRSELRRERR